MFQDLIYKLLGIDKSIQQAHNKKNKFTREMLLIQAKAKAIHQQSQEIISITGQLAQATGSVKKNGRTI